MNNEYDTGRLHGISLCLSYVEGYAKGTINEDVLYTLNKCKENFTGLMELIEQENIEVTE